MSDYFEGQNALADVLNERQAQDDKWGEQNHDPFTYITVLGEEYGELCQAALHARFGGPAAEKLREEAVQVAAVALAIVECLDRGKWRWPASHDASDDYEALVANEEGERHTCPRRRQTPGPWDPEAENIDVWRVQPNGDRTCSFCGGMHPADFEAFLRRVLEDTEARISHSTKPYKAYLHRPEVSNAGDGAIKYYKWHNPEEDAETMERMGLLFAEAHDVSRARFAASLKRK